MEKQLRLKVLQDSLGFESGFISDEKILNLKETQNSLSNLELLIEYHISVDDGRGVYTNNNRGYVMAISKDDIIFTEIVDMASVRKEVVLLRNLLNKPFENIGDKIQYNDVAYSLYSKLFPGDRLKNKIKGKKLNVIPDSYLALIPFEGLSSSKQALRYLLQDSQVHYSYSSSFTKQIEKTAPANVRFIGFSPESFEALSLTPLQNSSLELEFLDSYYDGKIWRGSDAKKTAFINSIPNANLIHVASHANASTIESPWIGFNDARLFLEEIYLIPNNASLVFLSGCNTTIGKQEIGEGVMSLARGFFYSGAQSVVSSLWEIDDEATAIIVQEFYKNLSQGALKSEALHHAKLSYLETNELSNSSPHYWASLILLGQDDTLVDHATPRTGMILIGLFFFVLFLMRKPITRWFVNRKT